MQSNLTPSISSLWLPVIEMVAELLGEAHARVDGIAHLAGLQDADLVAMRKNLKLKRSTTAEQL